MLANSLGIVMSRLSFKTRWGINSIGTPCMEWRINTGTTHMEMIDDAT